MEKIIAKKGEFVKIVDPGRAILKSFDINKLYQLDEDLSESNGFIVKKDNFNCRNGFGQAFGLGMKFEVIYDVSKIQLKDIDVLIKEFDNLIEL